MADVHDFSGIWHSTYHFTNELEGKGTSEHDVKIYQTGNQVVIQSLPNEEKSYIILRLTLDDNLLTGTWNEQTSPSGKYEGQIYYGALQLMIDKDGKEMHGKTVSFNHEMQIISDDWEIVRTDKKEK